MGMGGQHHALATLPLGRRPGTHFTEGWAAPIADLDSYGKILPPAGFISWTVQPIVSHYTVCTFSAHSLDSTLTMLLWLASHLYVFTVQRCWYTVASLIL